MQTFDPVKKAAHYNTGNIECIDAIEASMSVEEWRGFLKGNVLKYVWRYKSKGGLQDLKKAEFYNAKLIKSMEATAPKFDATSLIPSTYTPPTVTHPLPLDPKPNVVFNTNCRNWLKQHGEAYSKSNCTICGSLLSGSKCRFDVDA